MEGLFSDLVDWLIALSPFWAYLAILFIAYGENIVPPIPGDMLVVFAGYLVGIGKLNFFLVVVLATLGGALGFMTLYVVGIRIGDAIFDPERLKWLPKHQIFKARGWLRKWGYGVVLANRFLSGARSVISLTVGMARMSPTKTAILATVSAAVWTTLITFAGYAVGENWAVVGFYLRRYGQLILILLAIVALVWFIRWFSKRRKTREKEGNITAQETWDTPD